MELNPIDKVNDLLDVCKEFNPIIRKRTNEGYDWLKDTDVCIEILNPGSSEREEGMTIICEDGGEFTLCFHSHTHFSPLDYDEMCGMIRDILTNKMCAAVLSMDDRKIRGSRFLSRDQIHLPAEEIFEPVWLDRCEVQYFFWDSSQNCVVKEENNIKIDVVALDPSRVEDYLSLFDPDSANGVVCYCTRWNMTQEEIDRRIMEPVKKNEAQLAQISREIAAEMVRSGKIQGYLAYENGVPVGWCNCADKKSYTFLARHVTAGDEEEKIKSIVCMKVIPEKNFFRVGSALLAATIKQAREEGYSCIEAYPNRNDTLCVDFGRTMHLYVLHAFSLLSWHDGGTVWRKELSRSQLK
jgi:hypothetical protein